jgi:uncharacterized protein YqeY
MSLESKVMEELKLAMKAKDEVALRTLRAIKAAILIEKTSEGASAEITEADELKLLNKMAKQRRDSLEIFTTQNRADLAKKEEEELAIIERFLPQQLTPEELLAELQAIRQQTGASGPADMGRMMGIASKQLAGRADGKAISAAVKQLLAGS